MSDYPCTGCRSTRNGRLFFAYVHHYMDEDLVKRRVRLCPNCCADLLAPLLEGADYKEGSEWIAIERSSALRTHTENATPASQLSSASANTSMSIASGAPDKTLSAETAGVLSVVRPSSSSRRSMKRA